MKTKIKITKFRICYSGGPWHGASTAVSCAGSLPFWNGKWRGRYGNDNRWIEQPKDILGALKQIRNRRMLPDAGIESNLEAYGIGEQDIRIIRQLHPAVIVPYLQKNVNESNLWDTKTQTGMHNFARLEALIAIYTGEKK